MTGRTQAAPAPWATELGSALRTLSESWKPPNHIAAALTSLAKAHAQITAPVQATNDRLQLVTAPVRKINRHISTINPFPIKLPSEVRPPYPTAILRPPANEEQSPSPPSSPFGTRSDPAGPGVVSDIEEVVTGLLDKFDPCLVVQIFNQAIAKITRPIELPNRRGAVARATEILIEVGAHLVLCDHHPECRSKTSLAADMIDHASRKRMWGPGEVLTAKSGSAMAVAGALLRAAKRWARGENDVSV